jgi:RNA polymerase sigma-70 factor (sigma-E family)
VEQFSPALLRAACLLLRDSAAAEDVTQSALLRTFRHWDRARRAPEAYSRRVLVNLCRNHWRDERRHPVGELADEHEGSDVASLSDVEAVDQRLAIEDALAALPDQQREVLVLRFFLDLAVPQTAELLSLPEGTVKSATHRGLAALRKILEPQEVHGGQ